MKRLAVIALSLLTLLLSSGVTAQDSPVVNGYEPEPSFRAGMERQSSGEAIPDTTDWRNYFPIQIGNEWQYRQTCGLPDCEWSELFFGHKILSDTTIGGNQYWNLQTCRESAAEGYLCDEDEYIRYDEDNKMILRRYESNETWIEEWWGLLPCGLDADFNSVAACTGPGTDSWSPYAYGEPYTTIHIPPSTIEGVAHKIYEFPSYTIEVASGIGMIYHTFSPFTPEIRWARINGVEYGEPAFSFPSSSNEPPAHEPVALVEVYPNPFREHVTVTFSLAEADPVAVELVDVLGRVVVRRGLGVLPAGDHRETAETGSLPSGSYVVRVQRGSEVAASRVLTRVR